MIQAYLDTKNPDDSWIAGSIGLAYWSTSRIFQLALRPRERGGRLERLGLEVGHLLALP